MLKRLTIEEYRGFTSLEVKPLARVNVFVGPNNAGKTGVLEAAEIVARGPDVMGIVDILRRREEYSLEHSSGTERFPYDFRGLFHGRAPDLGSSFMVHGHNRDRSSVRCTLRALNEAEADLFQTSLPLGVLDPGADGMDALSLFDDGLLPLALELRLNGAEPTVLPLSGRFYHRRYETGQSKAVQFLGTRLLSAAAMSSMWDDIALTPKEEQTVSTLRIIEPLVQRVAILGGSRRPSVYLQLKNHKQRVPLGSMGDGIKRLFALALAIGTTPHNGTLLIDEVDTGIHHSVMIQMWELVLRSAQRFKFQAFVTTHSLDCLLALTRLLVQDPKYAPLIGVS